MRRSIMKIKGFGYILWHAKHELFHVLLGLMWAWILREAWHEVNSVWIVTAIVGSLLPDIDHLFYFFTYGRKDPYTKSIRGLIRDKEWRRLVKFIEIGHKHNTSLAFHNIYVIAGMLAVSAISFFFDWRTATVLFGSMVTHYAFDILEDIILLGRINSNWLRFGRPKK